MPSKLTVKREIVLRDGGGGYWLTVDPPHPSYPDEFILSRNDLYPRALSVMTELKCSRCRDETTANLANADATSRFFASRQPWANNEYVPDTDVQEPSFYDAKLLAE